MTPPRILRQIPDRIRVHLPDWSGEEPRELERCLRHVEGVRDVQANPLTGNVLVHFDSRHLSAERLLSELSGLQEAWCAGDRPEMRAAPAPPSGKVVLAKAVVGGTLGHAAADTLFYTGTAAASALGWSWLAPVAAVHLVVDVFVWGFALRPVVRYWSAQDQWVGPAGLPAQPGTCGSGPRPGQEAEYGPSAGDQGR
jgi:hypothetical protein